MANKNRVNGGKYAPSKYSNKKTRSITLSDAAWQAFQTIADIRELDSRAEYLERLVREECKRLGISLESS